MNFSLISHYCGIGGFTAGAIVAGVTPVLGIDYDPDICDAYELNFPGVLRADLSKVKPDLQGLDPLMPSNRAGKRVLIMQTSPSCKQYSSANKDRDNTSDDATSLRHTFEWYVTLKPDYVILENVTAYAKAPVFEEFVQLLEGMGYAVMLNFYDFADHGLPQNRKRLIMIAAAPGFSLPEPLTPRPAISWYQAILPQIPGLEPANLSKGQQAVFPDMLEDMWDVGVLSSRVGYYGKSAPYRKHFEAAPTIRASLADDGKGGTRNNVMNLITSEGCYKLSDRCLAILQGFPDWFKLPQSFKIAVRGIGNAVPPLIAEQICASILEVNK
jgi:site-specific DNA-cytosine methylase